jgi:hypothetical protein
MNNELERIWEEAVMTQLKVLSRRLPGGTKEIHENLSQDSLSPGRDLKLGPPDEEAGVLTTRLLRTMKN